MSIAVSINNPLNEQENKFYIPFSTQLRYYDFWLKGSEDLSLELIPFLDCLDINKEEWKILKKEIQKMMVWADINVDGEYRDEIYERTNFVIDALDLVFKRDDVVVNFG